MKLKISVLVLFFLIPFYYKFLIADSNIEKDKIKIFFNGINDNRWLLKKDYFNSFYLDENDIDKYAKAFSRIKLQESDLNENSINFNIFSFEVFKYINEHTNENFLISPLSAVYALCMVNYGADERTSSNIMNTLIQNQNPPSSFYDKINNDISHFKSNNININNSIWIQNDDCYQPNESYVKFAEDIFNSDVYYVDFYNNHKNLRNDINEWVLTKTDNTIKDLIKENDIKRNTVQTLINTIYLKKNWQNPFDSAKTKLKPFMVDKTEILKEMMYQHNNFYYLENDIYQFLELPLSESSISMLILLPKSNYSLNQLIFDYKYSDFLNDKEKLSKRWGSLYLPKFKTSYNTSFKEILIDLGMFIPFSPNYASFEGFWVYDNCKKDPPNNYIDIMNQNTYLTIDENGLEASAATSIIMNRITSINKKPFTFNCNKPFAYYLYDNETEQVLFFGKYMGN